MDSSLLSTQNILNKITQLDIMSMYFPESVSLTAKYISPFRLDNSAGCYFAYTQLGTLTFFDHADKNYGGDCFKIVMLVFNISFREALHKINIDFKLKLGVTQPFREDYIRKLKPFNNKQTADKKASGIVKRSVKPTAKDNELTRLKEQSYHFKVTARKWLKCDYDYWVGKYQIPIKLLKKYNIYPVQEYFKRKWNVPYFDFKYKHSDSNPCYCYKLQNSAIEYKKDDSLPSLFKFGVKLYKPLTNNSLDKWDTNTNSYYINGLEHLPDTGKLLIIASSMKDVLALVASGYSASSSQGESVCVPQEIMLDLKSRFTRIIFCFDRDSTGLKYSKEFAKLHDCEYTELPDLGTEGSENLNDFAEYREYLREDFDSFLSTLFYD